MAFIHKRFRVLKQAYINGSIHNAGDIVTIRYDANVGYPLNDVLEEVKEAPKADEMAARHKAELDKFDRVGEREALIAKQQKERKDFELQRAETELQERHKREEAELTARQKSEQTAFEKNPALTAAPPEKVKADLDVRHKEELDALKKRHAAEIEALKKAKEPEKKPEAPAPSVPPPAPQMSPPPASPTPPYSPPSG